MLGIQAKLKTNSSFSLEDFQSYHQSPVKLHYISIAMFLYSMNSYTILQVIQTHRKELKIHATMMKMEKVSNSMADN